MSEEVFPQTSGQVSHLVDPISPEGSEPISDGTSINLHNVTVSFIPGGETGELPENTIRCTITTVPITSTMKFPWPGEPYGQFMPSVTQMTVNLQMSVLISLDDKENEDLTRLEQVLVKLGLTLDRVNRARIREFLRSTLQLGVEAEEASEDEDLI